jgi:enoyl-CoA hydratase/carnithine racemase
MTDLVLTEDRGPVRHVVLNRPEKRNAFNADLVLAVGRALREASADDGVRVVVLRGEGPMFSSGMDLAALAGLSEQPDSLRPFRQEILDSFSLAETMAKATVCQIQGACIGGAMELALACDLRVMAADAIIGLPETRIGLIPDVGGSSRLPAVVGVGRAKELIMTGKLIDGTEAERIGLVNRVAPADELDAATEQLVNELLACAPIAVGLAKRVIDASARPALAATLELEVTAQQVCAASDDFAEGANAFREKRQPEFSGR